MKNACRLPSKPRDIRMTVCETAADPLFLGSQVTENAAFLRDPNTRRAEEKGSNFMKKPLLCVLAFLLIMGISAWTEAENTSQITDALRQAGVSEPVQLSQWGDTAACFAETGGVKRLIILEKK